MFPAPENVSAVIVAAGNATRMRSAPGAPRKPWLELAGKSLLSHTCEAFEAARLITRIVLVAHPEDQAAMSAWRAENPQLTKIIAVVPGGAERADSVRLGCQSAGESEVFAIHDAARPLVDPALIDSAVEAAFQEGAALLASPVTDTLKSSDDGEHASSTIDRSRLWAAQTPQCFLAAPFLELLARAEAEGYRPTDDAALWERWKGAVRLIESPTTNLKITRPEDLFVAEAILAAREGKHA